MIAAIIPEKSAPNIPPTIVPITPIRIASMNLAFLSPTIILPENHRTGASTIVDNTTLINNASKLIANFYRLIIVCCLENVLHNYSLLHF